MITLYYYSTIDITPAVPDPSIVGLGKIEVTDLQPIIMPKTNTAITGGGAVTYPHRYLVALGVQEDDSSYLYRALMQKPQLMLKFYLPKWVDIPVGAWCEYMGKTYTLNKPADIKKNGLRNIEYTLTMGGREDEMDAYKLHHHDPTDRRLKFSMCAKPSEFIDCIVANLNERDGAGTWQRGECFDANEKTIEFNHTFISEALQSIADTFETEWEITSDLTINLCKVEHFKDDPLPLSYGRGNGFVPGVGRTSEEAQLPIKRVYVQGTDRNINRETYGAKELLLPKGQTLEYEGRTYKSDSKGYYIERSDKISTATKEDSIDCSEIYPSRVGELTRVECVNKEKCFWNVWDSSLVEIGLDFNDYLIPGETMTIIFQSGMLAGQEFEVSKYDARDGRFELAPADVDGVTMPSNPDLNNGYIPVAKNGDIKGDTYAVFGVMLPEQYICNNETKTGASWDMFREAAKHLYENEDQKFTFKGELQALWAKRNWLRVGGHLKVGAYVLFTDSQFCKEGTPIRITGIKEFLYSPYSPTIELSNSVSGGKSVATATRDIANTEVLIEDTKNGILSFTKRRFRDAVETLDMLDGALDNYSNAVNPISVRTMATLIGDESLQFVFCSDPQGAQVLSGVVEWNNGEKRLVCGQEGQVFYLQHKTLGIPMTTRGHVNEYMTWRMQPTEIGELLADEKLYLYARVSRTATIKMDADGNITAQGETGTFVASRSPISMQAEQGYYHLLVGVLNSEFDADRSYVSLYGYTEILPGRITTDKIISQDGTCYFDLANNIIGGRIQFVATDGHRYEQNEYINNIINGTLIEGGFIKTSLINADAISVKRLEVVNDAGQGVKIIPDERAVGSVEIFDENGQQVSVFEGATYDGVGNLFGNSSGSMNVSPTSKTYQQITASPYTDQNYDHTDVISPVLHTDTPTEVTFNGKLSVYAYAGPVQNHDTSKPIKQSRAYAYLYVKLVTYADAECTNTICAKNLATLSVSASRQLDIYGEYRDYDNSKENVQFQGVTAKTTAGYHRIEVRCLMAAYSQDSHAKASFNSFSANYHSDFYVSRYFANGFCLGSRSDNYVMVNHGTNGMQFAAEMGDYGFRVTQNGIETRLKRGAWMRQPIKVCSFYTYVSATGATISNVQTFDGNTLTAERLTEGIVKVSFPSEWSVLNLSTSNAIVRITSVDGNTSCRKSVLRYINSTQMEIGISDDASLNDEAGAIVEIYLL